MNESTSRGPDGPPHDAAARDDDTARPDDTGDGDTARHGGDDDLLARLRAADPAAVSSPDLDALRGAVAGRLAATAASPAPGAVPREAVETEEDVEVVDQHGRVVDRHGSTVPVDELAQRRRRTGWPLRVAAVAAGALVVGGGGGYAIGAAGGTDSGGQPVIAVANPFGGPESAAEGDMGTAEMARGGGADMATSWMGFGRTVFAASGLSGEGGTARAWAFDPTGTFTAEAAAAAAEALGVAGEPRQEDMFWTVGPADGTGATLQLFGDGTVSLSFYDPAMDPWFCASPGVLEGGGAAGSDPVEGDVVVEPAPGEPCEERDLGAAPQGEAAEGLLRGLLGALGQDPGAYEVTTEDGGDQRWSFVTAYQVVDGQRTGLLWQASFTGGGLQSLNGSLADLVDLGEYAVVSPQEAVERLTDPRFGSGGGPVAYREGAAASGMDVPVSPGELPRPPSAGSAVPWPVSEVTITEARLGAALHTQPDGAALLLPTYELTGEDGSVWSVLALADEHLDMAVGR